MDDPWWLRLGSALRQFTAWLVLGLCLLFLGLPAAGMLQGMITAPVVPDPGLEPRREGQRMVVGASYLQRVGGIQHLHLAGSTVDIGYAHGALMGERIAAMEGDLLRTFNQLVPSFWLRHLVLGLVSWNNRNLIGHFQHAELRELAAMGHAHGRRSDVYRGMSPGFTRAVQYHALHDASQYMIDNPLVNAPQVGCTAVAVAGGRSTSGRPLVGRLFDFEGGEGFDRDKLVITCDPEAGQAFVSVVWPGMVGAVTGLNQAGIWISINAAVSDARAFAGRPIVLVVRQVLQHARSLDEAVAMVTAAELFVSSNVLIVSGDEARAVVVEVGPDAHALREMDRDTLSACNHFEDPAWALDAANQRRLEEGTSPRRLARARALLAQRSRHDPASLLALLRDRRGPDGLDVGFGNRGTINAWIGAHLVVADPQARLLYVCEPAHGLGRALAFGIDGPLDLEPLPEDRDDQILHAQRAARFESILAETRDMIARDERESARVASDHLLQLNPRSFAAHELAAHAAEDPTERRRLLERALELMPAYPADEARIRAALDPD